MKTFITTCLIAIVTIYYAQGSNLAGKIKFENVKVNGMSVSVSVDSASDIERTFQITDIKEVLNMTGENQDLTFEITCETQTKNEGVSKSVIYRAKGNSNQKEEFLRIVGKIREASIEYYKSKN